MAQTNIQVIAGANNSPMAHAYRALVEEHGHDALCRAYGLDTDDVRGGTHWTDVMLSALMHGDVDDSGNLT